MGSRFRPPSESLNSSRIGMEDFFGGFNDEMSLVEGWHMQGDKFVSPSVSGVPRNVGLSERRRDRPAIAN